MTASCQTDTDRFESEKSFVKGSTFITIKRDIFHLPELVVLQFMPDDSDTVCTEQIE